MHKKNKYRHKHGEKINQSAEQSKVNFCLEKLKIMTIKFLFEILNFILEPLNVRV